MSPAIKVGQGQILLGDGSCTWECVYPVVNKLSKSSVTAKKKRNVLDTVN